MPITPISGIGTHSPTKTPLTQSLAMRRSTRGGPPGPPASATSSSSLSSARRAHQPNQKASTPRSLSSEEELPRRSQRATLPSAKSESAMMEDGDDVDGDEEEVTRCICGQTDYPGPPDIEAFAGLVDAGDLFIQCDGCKVWQHGGCVGIAEESQVPDKYFCEKCEDDLHQVHRDSRGQKYSLYLPLHPKARKAAAAVKHEEKARKERESAQSRASVDPSTGKRRATMRSKEHDDEEEQLKRAIEESKREVEGADAGPRRNGKRGRDESEDKPEMKRQRTTSESRPPQPTLENESEDEEATPTAGKLKKAKGDLNHSARQAEQREKDRERDKARAEAAGRRQERAGRRRLDDPDGADEDTPQPTPSAHTSPPPASSQPGSPQPGDRSNKKGIGKKVKRVGNTFGKTRGTEPAESPQPTSRRRGGGTGSGSGDDAPSTSTNGGETPQVTSKATPPAVNIPVEMVSGRGKFGRGKKAAAAAAAAAAMNGNGTRQPGEEVEKTFPNMKHALEKMSRYLAQQQADLLRAGAMTAPTSAPSAAGMSPDPHAANSPALGSLDLEPGTKFEDLSSAQMAAHLQKKISHWQGQWAHLG